MSKKVLRFAVSAMLSMFIFTAFFVNSVPVSAAEEPALPAHDGYIVRFKDAESAALAKELIDNYPALFSEDGSKPEMQTLIEPFDMYTTYDKALVDALEDAGLLKYSELNVYAYLLDGYDYAAEPEYAAQWGHAAINLEEAFRYGVYGNDVTVAVIDSGVYSEHSDLEENLLPGIQCLNGGYDPNEPQDTSDHVGHGTNVASIIGAAVNGEGMVGAAHRTKVFPVKVTEDGPVPLSNISAAIFAAVFYGEADVLNISIGYELEDDGDVQGHSSIADMLCYALDNNVIVVAASGNSGNGDYNDNDAYQYPASFDRATLEPYAAFYEIHEGVISVANAKKSGTSYQIAAGSTYNDRVTVAAPGTMIRVASSSGSYTYNTGTSFASPYVAAVAALAKSVDPDITPAHFKELLVQTANRSVLGNDPLGVGLIDAGALIRTLALEKSRGGFLSPIDRRTDGGVTMRIWNPQSTEATLSLIAKTPAYRLTSSGFLAEHRVIGADEICEVSLAGLSDVQTGEVSCYLLDRFSFRPMYAVRKALAIN